MQKSEHTGSFVSGSSTCVDLLFIILGLTSKFITTKKKSSIDIDVGMLMRIQAYLIILVVPFYYQQCPMK